MLPREFKNYYYYILVYLLVVYYFAATILWRIKTLIC